MQNIEKTSENKPSPSFVKLAMKNMVRKSNQSIFHFAITAMLFLLFIVSIAWIARPSIPS